MPNPDATPDPTPDQWNVTGGSAQKNLFKDNSGIIIKDNQGDITIHYGSPEVPTPSESGYQHSLESLGIDPQTFVGREAELERLHNLLQTDYQPPGVQIVGMAGLGKTELAIQYGRAHLEAYPGGVVWCPAAEFGEALRDWMQARFFPDRDLRYLPSVKQQVAKGWQAWLAHSNPPGLALVIVDDVTDYQHQVAPYLPTIATAPNPFRFLFTGRTSLGKGVPQLEPSHLSPAAALAILTHWAGADRLAAHPALADTISARLGYLPLALVLAGSWLSIDPDRTLADLLASLEAQELTSPALERDPTLARLTAARGLQAAFALSWQQLPALCPDAQLLARVLSLFAPADIPWSLVEAVLHTYPASPAPASPPRPQPTWWQRLWCWLRRLLRRSSAPAPLHADLPMSQTSNSILSPLEAIATLVKTSLVQRVAPRTYRLHPLLREFFANQWAGADQPGWQLAWATALSQQAATLPRALTWEAARAHRPLEPHLAAASTWWQSQRTSLPQAKQRANDLDVVLFRLKEPVLFECTLAQACAAHDQARAYGAQGHLQPANQCFAEAEAGYRKAIDQARQALPAHSLQLAGYLRKLANLLRELGRYRAGIPPMQEALDIITARAQPLKLANYLNDLYQFNMKSHTI